MSWCLIPLLLVTFILFYLADAKTCYFKEGSLINVTCDVSASRSTSVLWQISEHNTTRTLFNCTMFTCKVDGSNIWLNDSDIMLLATSYLDSGNSFIMSSSLNGPVASINMNSLTSLRNLQCQTDNLSFDVCEQIEIYADPKNVTCLFMDVFPGLMSVQCLISPVRPIGIVDTPILIMNNVSIFNSSAFVGLCDLFPRNEQNGKAECNYYFDTSLMGAGDHQFKIVVSANVLDPDKALVEGNLMEISLSDDIKYVVCLMPEFDSDHLFKVKCLAPLPFGDVSCLLNVKTNGTFRESSSFFKQMEYPPNENILNTLALECEFYLFARNVGPGEHQFQVEMSKNTSDGKVIHKTSNWTSPWTLRYQSQMNFTANGSPDEAVVSLNETVSFHCSTDGIPPSAIKIEEPVKYYMSIYGEYLSGTDLSLPITSCQQAGLYTCVGHGAFYWDLIIKEVSVKIPCAQRLKRHSDNVQTETPQYVGKFYSTNTVEIPVIGYPSPKSMSLFREQDPDKTSITDGVSITYKENNVSPYGKIIVNFTNKGLISEMTKFTLRVNNGIEYDTLFDFSLQGSAQ